MQHDRESKAAPVIDIFTREQIYSARGAHKLVRIAPEYDGICMLYSNSNSGKLYNLKIIGWGLQANGEVIGLVPWLQRVSCCHRISDALEGHWEGYFNPANGDVFYEVPRHKQTELESAKRFFHNAGSDNKVVQEIPDNIGTHAVFSDKETRKLKVIDIFSWQLRADGNLMGMIIDRSKVTDTPVLIGDNCLYPAQEADDFRYFFQYRIANKIKEQDPEALEAIANLIDM